MPVPFVITAVSLIVFYVVIFVFGVRALFETLMENRYFSRLLSRVRPQTSKTGTGSRLHHMPNKSKQMRTKAA